MPLPSHAIVVGIPPSPMLAGVDATIVYAFAVEGYAPIPHSENRQYAMGIIMIPLTVANQVYVRRTRLYFLSRSRPPLLPIALPSSTHIHVYIPFDIDINITTRPCQTQRDNFNSWVPARAS